MHTAYHTSSAAAYLYLYQRDMKAAESYSRNAYGYLETIINGGPSINFWDRQNAVQIASYAHAMSKMHYALAAISREEYVKAMQSEA